MAVVTSAATYERPNMKCKVYLRVAKTGTRNGFRVSASSKPNNEPMSSGTYSTVWYPTIAFAINLDLPDSLFEQAERVIADLVVGTERAEVLAVVPQPSATTDAE